MDKNANSEHLEQHKCFTQTNGVKEVLHFLNAQKNDVENWLRANSDPAIEHAGSRENHPLFGRGIKYEVLKAMRKGQAAGPG